MMFRMMTGLSLLFGVSIAITGCGKAETTTSVQTTETVSSIVASSTVSTVLTSEPISCATEIGTGPADHLAEVCRNVSPATHPPCNTANSCAMIEDEIARSCALFDDKEPAMDGCAPAPKSSEAAAAVITRYYSALNARDFDTAWRQWGDHGQPNQTRETFQAGFAHTQSTRVTIGKLEPAEGGAGSIYQTVPVTIDATLDNGKRQRFTGDYTVRRVNGVDGASAEQLRWHIDAAHLKAVAAN
ncbi:hypothetical protein ABAC460_10320 [Asticcacaulis sp. AC460]|uniref:hypothetical protein n=1 Tax=Asticcacaulis sp. AC460 TaxID=1282360 RepID=UPI0003C3BBF5|nr:hypothetical protein [Asticcacaulis sp. AC460]ESQ90136.1 hypothetical protein ABAC460_10320 [Asticcacaulis sp. AC460]